MSESSQAGKGDDPRNIGPAFRAHFPEVDWSDKRPARLCANCGETINTSGYVVVGSKYYCNLDCRKGRLNWSRVWPVLVADYARQPDETVIQVDGQTVRLPHNSSLNQEFSRANSSDSDSARFGRIL